MDSDKPDIEFPDIPEYKPLQHIAGGSFGEVYLVRDALGHQYALKLLNRTKFSTQEDYQREFEALKAYVPVSREHASLVTVHHLGGSPGMPYYFYVMDLADNASEEDLEYVADTLSGRIEAEAGAMPVKAVRDISLGLADALRYLHSHNLLHRDVKPDNILFVKGQPVLGDPGLVKNIEDAGSFAGTGGYIAPEGSVDASSDQYSLGKTMYRMLTGLPVNKFPELSTASLSNEDNAVARGVNDVILKCCEINPRCRYPDFEQLVHDLNNAGLQSTGTFSRRAWMVAAVSGAAVAGAWGIQKLIKKNITVLPHSTTRLAGWEETLFIDDAGNVWSWGRKWESSPKILLNASTHGPAKSVAMGDGHALILTEDNVLFGTLENHQGQLGVGDTKYKHNIVEVGEGTEVTQVDAAASHTLFTKEDGALWGCGKNLDGRLGYSPSTGNLLSPAAVYINGQPVTGVTAISCGSGHNFFITGDQLYGMGRNDSGRLGDGTTNNRSHPVEVVYGEGAVGVGAGYKRSLFYKQDGSLWGIDFPPSGSGEGASTPYQPYVPQKIPTSDPVTRVSCGHDFGAFLTANKDLYLIPSVPTPRNSKHWFSQLMQQAQTSPGKELPRVRLSEDVIDFAAGLNHLTYLKSDGTLWSVGRNNNGQLGVGDTKDRFKPAEVSLSKFS